MSDRLPWRIVFDGPEAGGGRVYVGGVEISGSITSLRLDAKPGDVVTLTLTVVPERLEVSGFAVDEAPIHIEPLGVLARRR